MNKGKIVEWKCWAIPATPGVHCGHMNSKLDRRTKRDNSSFFNGLYCDGCGRPKAASDHRLAEIKKREQK